MKIRNALLSSPIGLCRISAILLLWISVIPISRVDARDPEDWWSKEKGIQGGRIVTGSISPDGRYALFEFNHWEGGDAVTTITGIGLAPVDRSKLLFIIDSRTKWETDKEVTSFLTFLWRSDSGLLATHDSGNKHSKLQIYRLADGRASSIDLPDLLAVSCAKLGIVKETVSSSGQIPIKWLENGVLDVKVSATVAGRRLTTHLLVQIAKDGKVSTP